MLTSDSYYKRFADSENKLVSSTTPGGWSTSATYKYDPLGRLQQVATAYSGYWAELVEDEAGQVVMEYGTLGRTRKYVFGPGSDEVLAQYFANATSPRRAG